MTPQRIVVVVLLTVGVSVQLVCAIGVLVTRDALDRLHFVSPAGILGAVPLLAAVILEGSVSHAARTVFVGVVLVVASPFVNRAIARGLHIREVGRFQVEARPPRREGDER
ncbi:MAG: monovalent cation/H(+) antiporter subunit G [Actinomycetota bacterium]|nr:monovalent cation/H(+) antiporter subunit G [Actinomycetota bacterium]